MTERLPRNAVNCTDQWDDDAARPADPGNVLDWAQARERLAGARQFWAASIRASSVGTGSVGTRRGAPHLRPVLGVWLDDKLYSTSNGTKAKLRNLAADPRVAFGTSTDEIDFIVEGTAALVTDEAELARVAEAYRDKYGWPLHLRDGELHAPFGAPAAGPPPYRPYAVTPDVIYGMGTNETFAPLSTRWQF